MSGASQALKEGFMVVRMVCGDIRRRWSGAGVTSECKIR